MEGKFERLNGGENPRSKYEDRIYASVTHISVWGLDAATLLFILDPCIL